MKKIDIFHRRQTESAPAQMKELPFVETKTAGGIGGPNEAWLCSDKGKIQKSFSVWQPAKNKLLTKNVYG